MPESNYTILIVEDDPGVNALLRDTLESFGYNTVVSFDGADALAKLKTHRFDLVLTDVFMPRVNGFEVCQAVKRDMHAGFIPVIILTGSASREHRIHGLDIGADEFLSKPFDPIELRVRVSSLLKLKAFTDELENAEQVLFSLALTVAAKDSYTRGHCLRIAHNTVAIGRAIGMSESDLRALYRGAFLHDIGKIAIPDNILQKAGQLDEAEISTMMEHTIRGEEICHPLKTLAQSLPAIRHHHERMDGKGYPDGLTGDAIPLTARIVGACDLLDALITDRPYRRGLPLDQAVRMLEEASNNGHLDPDLTAVLTGLISHQPSDLMLARPGEHPVALHFPPAPPPRNTVAITPTPF